MYYILSYSNLYTHHIIINVVTIKSSNRRQQRSSVFGALEDPVSEPWWSSVIRWNQGDIGGSMDWYVRNMEKKPTGHHLFFPISLKHRVSEVNVPLNQSIEWWVWMNEKPISTPSNKHDKYVDCAWICCVVSENGTKHLMRTLNIGESMGNLWIKLLDIIG